MLPISNRLSQVISVTRMSLQTILERRGSAAASVFGIAGVVAVLVGVLSIAQGFRAVMSHSGDPGVALIMRSGSDSEMMSIFQGAETRLIADGPGVAASPDGPLASPEVYTVINLPKRGTGTDANVALRGVHPIAFRVHRQLRLLEGRLFEPGRNEVIVGRGARAEFAGLEPGASLKVGRNLWTVVGVFEADGSVAESEVWCDATVLQGAYQRGNSYQTVVVRLESPEAFTAYQAALSRDPRLNVKVERQADYHASRSRVVYNLVNGLGTLIASLMGVGAVFGALNTMYSTVAARTREIATLRALGFGGGPIVISIMIEALVLALAGGALGGGAAYAVFHGYEAATMNWQNFTQVAFAFQVTPGLLLKGILYATFIGLIGGLFPALRAARLPVAQALREL